MTASVEESSGLRASSADQQSLTLSADGRAAGGAGGSVGGAASAAPSDSSDSHGGSAFPVHSEFVSRVSALPAVEAMFQFAVGSYRRLKDASPDALRPLFDVGEQTASVVAASSQPLLTSLQRPIEAMDSLACHGLDRIERRMPVIKESPDRIIAEVRAVASSAVDRAFRCGTLAAGYRPANAAATAGEATTAAGDSCGGNASSTRSTVTDYYEQLLGYAIAALAAVESSIDAHLVSLSVPTGSSSANAAPSTSPPLLSLAAPTAVVPPTAGDDASRAGTTGAASPAPTTSDLRARWEQLRLKAQLCVTHHATVGFVAAQKAASDAVALLIEAIDVIRALQLLETSRRLGSRRTDENGNNVDESIVQSRHTNDSSGEHPNATVDAAAISDAAVTAAAADAAAAAASAIREASTLELRQLPQFGWLSELLGDLHDFSETSVRELVMSVAHRAVSEVQNFLNEVQDDVRARLGATYTTAVARTAELSASLRSATPVSRLSGDLVRTLAERAEALQRVLLEMTGVNLALVLRQLPGGQPRSPQQGRSGLAQEQREFSLPSEELAKFQQALGNQLRSEQEAPDKPEL